MQAVAISLSNTDKKIALVLFEKHINFYEKISSFAVNGTSPQSNRHLFKHENVSIAPEKMTRSRWYSFLTEFCSQAFVDIVFV